MRQQGTAQVQFNFEPLISAPLDSRFIVDTWEDLKKTQTWKNETGQPYIYQGMIVYVKDAKDHVRLNNTNLWQNDNGWSFVSPWQPVVRNTNL